MICQLVHAVVRQDIAHQRRSHKARPQLAVAELEQLQELFLRQFLVFCQMIFQGQ